MCRRCETVTTKHVRADYGREKTRCAALTVRRTIDDDLFRDPDESLVQ
jgi:hypothetical protein